MSLNLSSPLPLSHSRITDFYFQTKPKDMTFVTPPRSFPAFAGPSPDAQVHPRTVDRIALRAQKHASLLGSDPSKTTVLEKFQKEAVEGVIRAMIDSKRLPELVKKTQTTDKCCSIANIAIYALDGFARTLEVEHIEERLFWSSCKTTTIKGVKVVGMPIHNLSERARKGAIANYHSERAAIIHIYKNIYRYLETINKAENKHFLVEVNMLTTFSNCSRCSRILEASVNDLQERISAIMQGNRAYLAILHKGIEGYHKLSRGLEGAVEYYPSFEFIKYIATYGSAPTERLSEADILGVSGENEDEEDDDDDVIPSIGIPSSSQLRPPSTADLDTDDDTSLFMSSAVVSPSIEGRVAKPTDGIVEADKVDGSAPQSACTVVESKKRKASPSGKSPTGDSRERSLPLNPTAARPLRRVKVN